MPIYEYECRGCGEQFELLVLKDTVAACPACQGADLEQLLSGFAVSTSDISKSNVKKARRKIAGSKDFIDKKVADAEDIREHMPEHMPHAVPKRRTL